MSGTLRSITPDDVEACVDLYVATFTAPPWEEDWRPEDARQRLTDLVTTPRSHGVVLLDDDGAVVGLALGRRHRSGTEDHFVLEEMCVAAARRREGLGSRLLEVLGEATPDVAHWHLLTAHDSPAAEFYVRHGFRPARRMGVFVRP